MRMSFFLHATVLWYHLMYFLCYYFASFVIYIIIPEETTLLGLETSKLLLNMHQ